MYSKWFQLLDEFFADFALLDGFNVDWSNKVPAFQWMNDSILFLPSVCRTTVKPTFTLRLIREEVENFTVRTQIYLEVWDMRKGFTNRPHLWYKKKIGSRRTDRSVDVSFFPPASSMLEHVALMGGTWFWNATKHSYSNGLKGKRWTDGRGMHITQIYRVSNWYVFIYYRNVM